MNVDICFVAQQLHKVSSEHEAFDLLEGLDARTLRLVAKAYGPDVVLRPKAGRDELVKRLILITVSVRLWAIEYGRARRSQQA
jgi:hypothetical protein